MSAPATVVGGRGEAVVSTVLDGVLNVDKPAGWTSHDVVAKLRGLLRTSRIGHAGTLDPAATGVLPVLVGRATRIAEYLLDWDKEYLGVLRLGETTDTLDATGTVLERRETGGLGEAAIREAVARFRGRISQVPPMYSAVKVGGVPLYKAARAGRVVERGEREVVVHAIDVLGIAGRDVTLRVVCGKGTYVRTLCADIGEVLGVGGHLLSLERRRVGPLAVDAALSPQALGALASEGRLGEVLMSLDLALASLPELEIDGTAALRARHGVPVPARAVVRVSGQGTDGLCGGQAVRLKDPMGALFGIGLVPEQGLVVGDGRDAGAAVVVVKVLASA